MIELEAKNETRNIQSNRSVWKSSPSTLVLGAFRMIPRILTRWLRLRRAKRLAKWYWQHPCAYSWQEPWLSVSERKHSK